MSHLLLFFSPLTARTLPVWRGSPALPASPCAAAAPPLGVPAGRGALAWWWPLAAGSLRPGVPVTPPPSPPGGSGADGPQVTRWVWPSSAEGGKRDMGLEGGGRRGWQWRCDVKFILQLNSRLWQIPSNVWGCIERRQQTNGHALRWIKFLANHSFLWSILLLTSLIWITQSDWCLAHFKPIRSNWMWVATLPTVLRGKMCLVKQRHSTLPVVLLFIDSFWDLLLTKLWLSRLFIHFYWHSTIQSAIQGCRVCASVVGERSVFLWSGDK